MSPPDDIPPEDALDDEDLLDVPGVPFKVVDHVVDKHAAGRRADVWLTGRLYSKSRTYVAKLFDKGRIEGLDRPLKPSSILMEGERIRLYRPSLVPTEPPPPLPEILYEDDRLIAFNKPAGLLVHPGGGVFTWSLIHLARKARPGTELHLAHRLDRDTSGVVLLAKDADANRHLKTIFREQLAEKVYWALCRGAPTWNTILVDRALGSAEGSAIRIKMAIRPDGQEARTRVFVKMRMAGLTLVACHPRTGRTHQIRVHLAHVGLPIVGDRIYGQPEEVFLHWFDHGLDVETLTKIGFPRHVLHARILRLPGPDGKPVEIRAPIPEDMREVLRRGCLPSAEEFVARGQQAPLPAQELVAQGDDAAVG